MASQDIPSLTAAGTLDGTELLHLVKGGNSRRATAADIAALASSGSSTVSELDDLSDVSAAHGVLSGADEGRPLGLVSSSPVTFGLLERLTSMPVSGGTEIIAEADFTDTAAAALTIPDTHLWDEVHVYFFDISADDWIEVSIYPDGSTLGSIDYTDGRVQDDGTTFETLVDERTNGRCYLSEVPVKMSGFAKFTGLKAGQPLVADAAAAQETPKYFRRAPTVYRDLGEIRGLSFRTDSGQIVGGSAVVVGIRHAAQPLAVPFDYSGSPAGAGTLGRFVVPMSARVRSGAQGSFKVATNPTSEVVLEVHLNGSSIGTVTIPATTGDPVVSITADEDLSAGDVLTLEATGAGDFTDIYGSLLAEGRG